MPSGGEVLNQKAPPLGRSVSRFLGRNSDAATIRFHGMIRDGKILNSGALVALLLPATWRSSSRQLGRTHLGRPSAIV